MAERQRYYGGATRGRRGGPVKFTEQEYADASMLEKFKYKAREWWSQVGQLRKMDTRGNPALTAQKQKLLDRADTIRGMIEKLGKLHDSLKVPGLNGVGGPLLLVPIAVVGAALAAITYWGKSFAEFLITFKEYTRLVESGMEPEKAMRISRGFKDEDDGFKLFGVDLKIILLGVGGFLAWRFFMKRREA